MKATKTAALACYDSFFGVLRCLNGGTSEENKRQAPACLEGLEKHAAEAKALAANPSKLLRADAWLWEALTVTIPARLESFRTCYFSESGYVPGVNCSRAQQRTMTEAEFAAHCGSNVIQFPAQ